MKSPRETAAAWLRMARDDLRLALVAREIGVTVGSCYHAQQTAEKALKAYLIFREREFPRTHNLKKLVVLCAEISPEFDDFLTTLPDLTAYAVESRYDEEFLPDAHRVDEAITHARSVLEFIERRLNP